MHLYFLFNGNEDVYTKGRESAALRCLYLYLHGTAQHVFYVRVHSCSFFQVQFVRMKSQMTSPSLLYYKVVN